MEVRRGFGCRCLGRIPGRADRQSRRRPRRERWLLNRMSQLVHELSLASDRAGVILSARKNDVTSHRVSIGTHGMRTVAGSRSGVDADVAEIVMEACLHELARCCIERLAAFGQHLMNNRRRSALGVVE